jgi:urease accessory protein
MRFSGPLRVQRPFHPENAARQGFALPCHCYLLHPPGGIVSGDDLETALEVEPGAHCLATTPAADKFYRGDGTGARQRRTSRAVVRDGVLEWLPHPVICFDGSRGELVADFHLHGGSLLLAWDLVCLGREAGDEPFRSGGLTLTTRVWRDDAPILQERLSLDAEGALRTNAAGLGGASVFGTFCCVGDGASLERAKQALSPLTGPPPGAGASPWAAGCFRVSLRGGALVGRYLGMDGGDAWDRLGRAWEIARPVVLGLPPVRPRIWET